MVALAIFLFITAGKLFLIIVLFIVIMFLLAWAMKKNDDDNDDDHHYFGDLDTGDKTSSFHFSATEKLILFQIQNRLSPR